MDPVNPIRENCNPILEALYVGNTYMVIPKLYNVYMIYKSTRYQAYHQNVYIRYPPLSEPYMYVIRRLKVKLHTQVSFKKLDSSLTGLERV